MVAESRRRRRRWVVPALLLGAGAGAWVVVRRRPAAEPVDVWAPRPPVERMIVASEPAVPTPAPDAADDEPMSAVRPLLATPAPTPAVATTANGAAPAHGSAPAEDTTAPPYGPGSAAPLPDGSAPAPEYTIKGNASSRLFHPPSSPYYGRTKAEVWFRTADDAVAAGFSPYRSRRR